MKHSVHSRRQRAPTPSLTIGLLLLSSLTFVGPSLAVGDDFAPGEHRFARRDGLPDQFDAIGRIECNHPTSFGLRHVATGWLAGDNQTVVTAAHLFYTAPHISRTSEPAVMNPADCVFLLYNRRQKVRAILRFAYGVSLWQDGKLRYDSSFDIAALRLRSPAPIGVVPQISGAHPRIGHPVSLFAFRATRWHQRLLHVTTGAVAQFPRGQVRLSALGPGGLRITNPDVLFASSANAGGGASGGMYYYQPLDGVIGIHLGYVCDLYGKKSGAYDGKRCFNYGLSLAPDGMKMISSVNADRPDESLLISADRD